MKVYDECHICMDYLGVQKSFLGIKMNSYMIYTPIYSIMCGFCVF